MGNQGYSNEGTRQAAEMIWSGEIGNVAEVHAWTDRPMWPQGLTEIPAPDAVPETLDWDLWLGIAEARLSPPAARLSHRFRQLLPALQLARLLRFRLRRARRHGLPHPGRAEPGAEAGTRRQRRVHQKEGTEFMFPQTVIRFDFPARGNMPPVKLFWYDGVKEHPTLTGCPQANSWAIFPPFPRAPRRPGDPPPVPAPRTGFVGSVFNWNAFQSARSPEAPRPRPMAACSSATKA